MFRQRNDEKRYIVAGIVTVLVLVFLTLAVWLFPLIRAAFLLHDMAELRGFRYEISMELDEENLSEKQKQLTNVLAWALSGGESSGMSWKVTGRVSDGLAYGQVYCEGCEEPVTELYVGQEEGLINVQMLYDSIRGNLIAHHPLLGSALPEWGYGDFLSSTQMEEIFQVDLEELFRIEELTENHVRSSWESFRVLMAMKSRKGADGGRQFETELGDYQVVLEITKDGEYPSMDIRVSDRTEVKEVASYTGKFAFQEAEKIVFPDSLMAEKEIQQFEKLWSVIDGLQKMLPES